MNLETGGLESQAERCELYREVREAPFETSLLSVGEKPSPGIGQQKPMPGHSAAFSAIDIRSWKQLAIIGSL